MFRHVAVIAGYSCDKAQTNHVRRILQPALALGRIMMYLHVIADRKGADIVRVGVASFRLWDVGLR
jgi:hypothetical protein